MAGLIALGVLGYFVLILATAYGYERYAAAFNSGSDAFGGSLLMCVFWPIGLPILLFCNTVDRAAAHREADDLLQKQTQEITARRYELEKARLHLEEAIFDHQKALARQQGITI